MNFQPVVSKYSTNFEDKVVFLVPFQYLMIKWIKAEYQTLRSRLMYNRDISKVEW